MTNAFRISAAETAISIHASALNPAADRPDCNHNDALELLRSLSLWAETNGFCLRIPKPEYEESTA